MPISPIGIWIKTKTAMSHWSFGNNSEIARDGRDSRFARFTPVARDSSRLTPYGASHGFTILEIIIVLFLLVGLLGIILPRISLDENLGICWPADGRDCAIPSEPGHD